MKKLSALCLALLLTACGGSSSNNDTAGPGIPVPPVNPPTPAPVVNDSFFSTVMELIGMAPEDADDVTVEGILLTAPDDTDPVELG